jgi:stage V sporulation protein S
MSTTPTDILKASATTSPVQLAGAIAAIIREHATAEVHAVGAAAVNQTLKAIAIARGYLAPNGIEIACIPSFVDLTLDDGVERTGMRLQVVTRRAD